MLTFIVHVNKYALCYSVVYVHSNKFLYEKKNPNVSHFEYMQRLLTATGIDADAKWYYYSR